MTVNLTSPCSKKIGRVQVHLDIKGLRVFIFRLDDKGQYYEVEDSVVLSGLSIALLEAAMAKLDTMTNMDVALWFQTQIAQAKE